MKSLPGWKSPTRGLTRYRDLPLRARDYLNFLSERTGVEIGLYLHGTGARRDYPDRRFTAARVAVVH